MKKLLLIVILSLLWCSTSYAATSYHNYAEGDIVENVLVFGKKSDIKIPLPEGKWEVGAIHMRRTKGTRTKIHEVALFQFKDDTYKGAVLINVSEKVNGYWVTPKWCKRKSVYFIKTNVSGKNYNCWFVNHFRTSMSHEAKGIDKKIVDYLVNKRIKIPDIAIYSQHESARQSKGINIFMQYFVNPELEGIDPPIGLDWNTSEYQKTKVFNHPKKEKFLNDYIKRSAQLQATFEELNNFKPKRRIDTSEYGTTKTNQTVSTSSSGSDDVNSKKQKAKNECKELGFKEGTEKFGDCVIKMLSM